MSTYSSNLRLELIGNGEQAGTWGTTTNVNLGTLLEGAISGYATVSVTSANQALTANNGASDEARLAMLRLTTTTTAAFNVYVPPVSKQYVIRNDTSYVATIYNSTVIGNTTAAGLGVAIPAGKIYLVASNGTDFRTIEASTVTNGVYTVGDQTIAGIKTFSSSPVLPGNATTNLQAVPKQQLDAAITTYFPSGTRLAFAQAAAPTGWTQDTTDNATNRMLRVVNTAGNGIGGTHSPILNNVVPSHTHGYSATSSTVSNDHTHSGVTGYMNQNASHAHSVYDPGHAHAAMVNGADGSGSHTVSNVGNQPYYTYPGTTSASGTGISIYATDTDHTHSFTTGGISASHTHTVSGTTDNGSSQTNWAPRYIDMIICSKN